MNTRTTLMALIGAAAVSAVTVQAADVPTDPPVFSDPLAITNRYHPFVPGTVKHLETQQGHTDAEVFDDYLSATRTFPWNGSLVPTRILRETAIEDGVVVEISWNYFAQADNGSVYYFGEVVDNYVGGVVDNHDGSWLVGGPTGSDPPETATAQDPTVFMPADPEVGDVFKPEDLFPFVDETAEVLRTGISVSTPAGRFEDCIQIRESTLLSDAIEHKWYAPGVGVIKVKERSEVLVLDNGADGTAAGVADDPPVFGDPLSITNPYHPFVVGRVKRFEAQQGHSDEEVFHNYLPETRSFSWNGTVVACHTLQEYELEDGELSEISWNYFAQADDGTVYYFGEVVDEYENGAVVGHGGSWLVGGPTGSDPAETATAPAPTVFMPDDPQVGDVFKPEDLFPIVDETSEVIRTGRNVHVPAGAFVDCLQIVETTQLSDSIEAKWWAPGIGVVKEKESGKTLVLHEVIDP